MTKRGKKKKGGRRAFKRAAKALKTARQEPGRTKQWRDAVQTSEEADDDAPEARELRMRRSRETFSTELGKQLAEEAGEMWLDPDDTGAEFGRVAGIRGRRCRVLFGDKETECLIPTDIAMFQRMALAVGDLVSVDFGADEPTISGVARRRSKLSRPDPHMPGMERVFAANIETVVIVAAAKQPPFNPRAVDRYLVAAQAGGAEPLLCVNKLDLVDDWPEESEMYRRMDFKVLGTSAMDGRGVDELVEAIAGRLCVFVGASGVGKSSLLNAIEPGIQIHTLEVRESDGRGRHATTFSSLYTLSCGAQVVDTPGVREIGLYRMAPQELPFYFPEFHKLPPCRFRDCTHTHEPGCAVKEAVESGGIPQARYDSYVRILESLLE